jgi:hypothetical protein
MIDEDHPAQFCVDVVTNGGQNWATVILEFMRSSCYDMLLVHVFG